MSKTGDNIRDEMPKTLAMKALIFVALTTVCAGAQEFISVTVAPGAVAWPNLVPGSATNVGSTSVVVTTTWSIKPGGGPTVRLYAYFNNANAALQHTTVLCSTGCPDIPSSAFQIKVNGGAFQSVSGTGPFGAAGASLQLFSVPILGSNKDSARADTLQFNINLSSQSLQADTYTGVLNIAAQSIP